MDSSSLLKSAESMILNLENKVKQLEEKLKQTNITTDQAQQELSRTEKTRLTKSSGKDISSSEGRIGINPFPITSNPTFLEPRLDIFNELYEKQQQKLSQLPREPITITLPDGATKSGLSFETTPLNIAAAISPGLAKAVIIARVTYSNRKGDAVTINTGQDELNGEDDADVEKAENSELWDLTRPLEGDCSLELLKFEDDQDAKMVFWHSSAHMLGQCLECELGSHLTVGPPVNPGFYYDSYLGENGTIGDKELKTLDNKIAKVAKESQEFQRLVLSKEDAIRMFKYNPYKVSILKNKVKDGEMTSVYRNGPFVDLCPGPHIPNTSAVKAVELKQATSAYWLGQEGNDRLLRVHGVSFPDKKLLKEYKTLRKLAEENDHRKKGLEQDLFFFHPLSPGCAFWAPSGARIFNSLVQWIQGENRKAGYQEVVTPNVFSTELWKVSGHWEHYKDNMFTFTDGEQKANNLFGLKPMNCPGHCLIYESRVRSYRDLPLRLSDFGVLHRNEASGALSGLARVRRFQQDDAHIFCRPDQVKKEVTDALELVKGVYDVLGLSMKVYRSTRPKKAAGLVKEDGSPDPEGIALWDKAEDALADALNEFVGKGNWRDKKGDGAFYGPKIDIEVFDALKRKHQCATVQLDFQMPRRFGLKYTTKAEGAEHFERPVMIHRAMLGSIERMTAILTEHFGGKWPFWLSPRQVMIIPVSANSEELTKYAEGLKDKLYKLGFMCDVDLSTKTLNKKVLLAQKEQYNLMFIVGASEVENGTVNVRTRRNNRLGEKKVDEMVELMQKYVSEKSKNEEIDPEKSSAAEEDEKAE